MAIAFKESSFTQKAISKDGGYGLFQKTYMLDPKRTKKKVLNDIEYAKRMCIADLERWSKVHNGNKLKTLASYNAGYKYKNGLKYAKHVLRLEKQFKEMQYNGII